ncbi:hypothetical protein ATANTOWER_024615 [Ataeniobius toweri]|uniref:Uncharacterized protein n=1 Tax=Ataeniobius toweri TaxID=208326 RepID=A0ABU7AGV4_9TELE|nr:hypothetical protein [Ataeniobius toweri]
MQLQSCPQSESVHIDLYLHWLWASWCPSPAVYRREAGSIQDRSPVHRRATQRHTEQTTIHTSIHYLRAIKRNH